MNVRVSRLVLAGALLLALAAAQPAAGKEGTVPATQKQMYEDIEILRRLLNDKLLKEYPPAKAMADALRNNLVFSGVQDDWTRRQNLLAPYLNTYRSENENFFIPKNAVNPNDPYGLRTPLIGNNNTYTGITLLDQGNQGPWLRQSLVWPLPERLLDTEGT